MNLDIAGTVLLLLNMALHPMLLKQVATLSLVIMIIMIIIDHGKYSFNDVATPIKIQARHICNPIVV